jgi:hypothetical protein
MKTELRILGTTALLAVCGLSGASAAAREVITFNDNGGWCWFQDERAIMLGGKLIIGSVANTNGTASVKRRGNIEVTTYSLKTATVLGTFVLHEHLQDDDHASPAFLVLPDGRVLAAYSRHGNDKFVRCRITAEPLNTLAWQREKQIIRDACVTYSNLFYLKSSGRIYNFYRGENWNPNFIFSDDDAQTWVCGGRLIAFDGRPYVKYASDNVDTIHFVTTEHHPRNYDNSIYHAFLKDGCVYRSDGSPIKKISEGPIQPSDATLVYKGSAASVAWPIDLHLDKGGRPFVVYSVQTDDDPNKLSYRYARFDGAKWRDYRLAHAGSALYEAEADYSGLAALVPHEPNIVFFSSNADPATGKPLISSADNKRHYEIFRAQTSDKGATWKFEPITENSTADNIRPIVPISDSRQIILLWLRGKYNSYTNYDLDVVGTIWP